MESTPPFHRVPPSASPFEKLDKAMTKNIGMGIYRTFLILGLLANLWLSTHFVRRSEFDELQKDVSEIKVTLRIMSAQDKKLDDHESRLRALESQARPIFSIK